MKPRNSGIPSAIIDAAKAAKSGPTPENIIDGKDQGFSLYQKYKKDKTFKLARIHSTAFPRYEFIPPSETHGGGIKFYNEDNGSFFYAYFHLMSDLSLDNITKTFNLR